MQKNVQQAVTQSQDQDSRLKICYVMYRYHTCLHRRNTGDTGNIHHGRPPPCPCPFRRRGSLEQRVQQLECGSWQHCKRRCKHSVVVAVAAVAAAAAGRKAVLTKESLAQSASPLIMLPPLLLPLALLRRNKKRTIDRISSH